MSSFKDRDQRRTSRPHPVAAVPAAQARRRRVAAAAAVVRARLERLEDRRLFSVGELDATFAAPDGFVVSDTDGRDAGYAVAVQPDGKIVVAGDTRGEATSDDFLLARYNPDGSPDTTFGDRVGGGGSRTGRTTLDFTGGPDNAGEVAVLPNGKILVAGSAYVSGSRPKDIALAQFNTDGSLDDGTPADATPADLFGAGGPDGSGKATAHFGGEDSAGAIALQNTRQGSKILLGGMIETPGGWRDFGLVRFNADGSLDLTFGGGDGASSIDFGNGRAEDVAVAVAVEDTGTILLGGFTTGVGSGRDFALVRHSADGSYLGRATADFAANRNDTALDMALTAEGRILLAGHTALPGGEDMAVMRFNADLTLDAGFTDGVSGTGKSLVTPAASGPRRNHAQSIALQPDGRIILGGFGFFGLDVADTAIARLLPGGSLDGSFGRGGLDGDGWVTIEPDGRDVADYCREIALLPDGKIVAAGSTTEGVIVSRFTGDNPAAYTITELGTLGGAESRATDLNNAGQVTGYSNVAGDARTHAFLWTAGGGMQDLGTYGLDSYSRRISETGQIVGHSYPDAVTYRGLNWSAASGLSAPMGTLGGTLSAANGVNSVGQIVGLSHVQGNVANHAFLYSAGQMRDLGTLGGSNSLGWAINALGQVVGNSHTLGDSTYRAFFWSDAGGMVSLGALGGNNSFAWDISDHGQTVGWADVAGNTANHAARWVAPNPSGIQDLGTLGGRDSTAVGVNETGQVVGWSHFIPGDTVNSHAFVWSDANGNDLPDAGEMSDLNHLIPAESGWTLTEARGVNDRGQIVGHGIHNGQTRAFLLTPRVNVAPTASAGGPYKITTGEPLTLDATASADPDGDALTYSWDVNGDGTFGDAMGAQPSLTWTQLRALGVSAAGSYGPRVRVDDGHGHIVDSAAAGLTVGPSAKNYVVLFSGGIDAKSNRSVYYKNLKRMYSIVTERYGVAARDVHVLYADGSETGVDQPGGINSNMAFANGSKVLPATKDDLRTTLLGLAKVVTPADHVLFWTFDHGQGKRGQSLVKGEEVLQGWGAGNSIRGDELAVWLRGLGAAAAGRTAGDYDGVAPGYAGLPTGHATYVFAQCYAGGMLDALRVTPLPPTSFGAASSNHYEESWNDGFAAGFAEALEKGFGRTGHAFAYALDHDTNAKTYGGLPNSNDGKWTLGREHPWAAGGDFPIFAPVTGQNAVPEIASVTPLKAASATASLVITYDMMVAATDVLPTAEGVSFRFTAVDGSLGKLLRDGSEVDPANAAASTLSYGQSVVWQPTGAGTGLLEPLKAVVVAADGGVSAEANVPVRVGNPPSGVVARDDAAVLRSDSTDVVVGVLANDSGARRTVLRVGQPRRGTVVLDPATGQVKYTPAPGFVGEDSFSYAAGDGASADLAMVKITVVDHDPAQAPQLPSAFRAMELPPPPGWAGIPEDWGGDRLALRERKWEGTDAIDIGDDGTVLVGTSRKYVDGVEYVGGTRASYLWPAGEAPPHWGETGDDEATNAVMLLRYRGTAPSGKAVYDGVEGRSAQVPDLIPYVRYLPDANTGEKPLMAYGLGPDPGAVPPVWYEPSTDWGPVGAVAMPAANASGLRYLVAATTNIESAAEPRQAELYNVAYDGQALTALPVATLPGWGGATKSEAYAITVGAGGVQVVGYAEYEADKFDGFLWQDSNGNEAKDPGEMQRLAAAGGFPQSKAVAVNASGEAVGFSGIQLPKDTDPPQSGVATLWSNGQEIALGTVGGNGWGIAYDINDAGLIVGASNGRAVVWSGADRVLYDLNSRYGLTEPLPAGATLTLTAATGINRAGQIVATGEVKLDDGKTYTRAYLLDLPSGTTAVQVSLPHGVTASQGATFTYDPNTRVLNLTGGTITFAEDLGDLTNPGVAVTADGPNANLVFNSRQHLASLTLLNGARATMTSVTGGASRAAGSQRVLVLGALNIDNAATGNGIVSRLDLGNNDMILRNANPAAAAATIARVSALTQRGYAGTAWSGNGIASSSAQTDPNTVTGLGLLLNNGADVSTKSTFAGEQVGATDVLVKYTYYGDGDLNGVTNAVDYGNIDFNQGTAGSWAAGDFDYNGLVNGVDYGNIDFAFRRGTGGANGSPL